MTNAERQMTPEHIIFLKSGLEQVDMRQLSTETLKRLHALMVIENENIRDQIAGVWDKAEPGQGLQNRSAAERRWHESACKARKTFGVNILRLNIEIKRRKKTESAETGLTYERAFLELAKAELDTETFERIKTATHKKFLAEQAEKDAVRLCVTSAYEASIHRVLETARKANRNRVASTARSSTFDDGVVSVFAISAGLPSLGKRS